MSDRPDIPPSGPRGPAVEPTSPPPADPEPQDGRTAPETALHPEPAPEPRPAPEPDPEPEPAAGPEPDDPRAAPADAVLDPGPAAAADQPSTDAADRAEATVAGSEPALASEPEPVAEPTAEPVPPAAAAQTEPAPVELPPVDDAAPLEPREPPPGPATEHIEWRPVVTGEQIEWQPVLKPEADTAAGAATDGPADDPLADRTTGDGPEFQGDEAWDEPVPAGRRGAAVAGSGGVSRARRPATSRPPARPSRDSGGGEGKPPPNQRRQVILLSVLTAVVVIVAVLGVVLSRGAQETGSEATAPPTTSRTSGTGTTVPATELTTFRDDVTGFTIRYPRAWNRLVPPIADIRLVLVAGENDAVSIRILPIQTPATTQNIANFKAVTDAIVFGDMSNKLVQEQLVTLNGKLTYYYLYTFNDQATGQQGVHAHYFVFEGHRMYSMVFQAQPAEDFPRLAAVFDQVAESFNVAPEQPGQTTTTAAPPTTR